jgi:hypothetical protein
MAPETLTVPKTSEARRFSVHIALLRSLIKSFHPHILNSRDETAMSVLKLISCISVWMTTIGTVISAKTTFDPGSFYGDNLVPLQWEGFLVQGSLLMNMGLSK